MSANAPQWTVCVDCQALTKGRTQACSKCGGLKLLGLNQPPKISESEMERLLMVGARTRGLKVELTVRWIEDLHRLTQQLVTGAIVDERDDRVALYWIKLAGALEYFPDIGDVLLEALERALPPGQSTPSGALVYLQLQRALGMALPARFVEDELIYIYWRRQVEAHVDQAKFHLSVKASGEIKETWSIPTITRPLLVEEMISARERILTAHGSSDLAAARAFARKSARAVLHLAKFHRESIES